MENGKLLALEGLRGFPKGSIDSIKELILRNDPQAKFSFFKQPYITTKEEEKEFEEIISLMREDPYKSASLSLRFFIENRKKYKELLHNEISSGKYVILDRYWHSNFAFQGAQGISLEEIAKENKELPVPDLTFVFESSVWGKTGNMYPMEKNKKTFGEHFERKVESYYRSLGYLLPGIIGDRSIRYIVADRGENILKEQMEPMIEMYLK